MGLGRDKILLFQYVSMCAIGTGITETVWTFVQCITHYPIKSFITFTRSNRHVATPLLVQCPTQRASLLLTLQQSLLKMVNVPTVHTDVSQAAWPVLMHAGFVGISCDMLPKPSVPSLRASRCTRLETNDLLSQDRHRLLLMTHPTLYTPTLYTPHAVHTPHCTRPTL